MPNFESLPEVAAYLRVQLEGRAAIDGQPAISERDFLLIYAHNGAGKTRLSTAFKDLGKSGDHRDTLYFNAFTEDLFSWDNDLQHDRARILKLNNTSRFFSGLEALEMDTRIKRFLDPYCDFDFRIERTTDKGDFVVFSRRSAGPTGGDAESAFITGIKVSRGEEQLFKWSFFLAILELALDAVETDDPYFWVKYVYIDDPVSSLDEHNAIAIANRLITLLKRGELLKKTVISTHHALFFNVLANELKQSRLGKFVLGRSRDIGIYSLTSEDGDTPYFQHISLMQELHNAAQSGQLYTYHFNILRTILEKTAMFHGHHHFSACLANSSDEASLHARLVNIMSHGKYSLYDPLQMTEDNKELFALIFTEFRETYLFNFALFPEA